MGLIRKAASVSTLGGVKYTSRREAETKERIANARLANAQAGAVRGVPATAGVPFEQRVADRRDASEVLAVEHVDAHLRGEYPKWKLTTRERLMLRKASTS